jgi:hypothetical protein
MKETLKQANYKYIRYLGYGEHLLMDKSTGKKEIFFANKNHASWGIIWKNTHLEFAHSINVYSDKNEDNAH